MKSYKPTYSASALFLAVLFCLPLSSVAQQKIGFIDSEYILSNIPQYNGINERLSVLTNQWRTEISEMQNEIKDLETEFEAKEILYTDEVKEQKLKEIEQKKKELESFRTQKFGPNGEYFRRQQELLEPLQQRVLEAVNFISERDKFDYVFDRTGDYMFLYTNPEWDISEDVLLEMGIDIEDIDER